MWPLYLSIALYEKTSLPILFLIFYFSIFIKYKTPLKKETLRYYIYSVRSVFMQLYSLEIA